LRLPPVDKKTSKATAATNANLGAIDNIQIIMNLSPICG